MKRKTQTRAHLTEGKKAQTQTEKETGQKEMKARNKTPRYSLIPYSLRVPNDFFSFRIQTF